MASQRRLNPSMGLTGVTWRGCCCWWSGVVEEEEEECCCCWAWLWVHACVSQSSEFAPPSPSTPPLPCTPTTTPTPHSTYRRCRRPPSPRLLIPTPKQRRGRLRGGANVQGQYIVGQRRPPGVAEEKPLGERVEAACLVVMYAAVVGSGWDGEERRRTHKIWILTPMFLSPSSPSSFDPQHIYCFPKQTDLGVHEPGAREARQAGQVDVALLPRVVARDMPWFSFVWCDFSYVFLERGEGR